MVHARCVRSHLSAGATVTEPAPSPALWAVLLTFDRPDDLARHLEILRAQVEGPDHLVVVDNGDGTRAAELADRHRAAGHKVTLIVTGDNLGPAGGWDRGIDHVLEVASDRDWVMLLDDNDPPRLDTAIRDVMCTAHEQHRADPSVAGVGIVGARFDRSTGVIRRLADDELTGAVEVDMFGGNALPTYLVAALREVGGLRADLFFGFEDLDIGLRLRRAGYRIVVDGRSMEAERRHAGNLGKPSMRRTSVGDHSPWRRYYTVRNMISISRDLGHTSAAMRITLRSGVAGPLFLVLRRAPMATAVLRMSLKGSWDGWRGRSGRTVEPARSGLAR